MITFIAHFTVAPENAAAFEKLLDHVVTMSNTEPGVVHYGLSKSVEDANSYAVVEIYRDQDAVAAHGNTAWVAEAVPKFLSLVEGMPQIRQYVSAGSAAVAGHLDDLS